MDEIQKTTKKNKSVITLILVALITTGLGFIGGIQYQKSQKANIPMGTQAGVPNGSNNPGVGRNGTNSNKVTGNQPISGEITAIDGSSITVKTQDGGSKIVILSNSTKISVATEGSVSDLSKGDTIMVIGTTGTDGTLTAQTVSIGVTGLQFRGGMNNNNPPTGN